MQQCQKEEKSSLISRKRQDIRTLALEGEEKWLYYKNFTTKIALIAIDYTGWGQTSVVLQWDTLYYLLPRSNFLVTCLDDLMLSLYVS